MCKWRQRQPWVVASVYGLRCLTIKNTKRKMARDYNRRPTVEELKIFLYLYLSNVGDLTTDQNLLTVRLRTKGKVLIEIGRSTFSIEFTWRCHIHKHKSHRAHCPASFQCMHLNSLLASGTGTGTPMLLSFNRIPTKHLQRDNFSHFTLIKC